MCGEKLVLRIVGACALDHPRMCGEKTKKIP